MFNSHLGRFHKLLSGRLPRDNEKERSTGLEKKVNHERNLQTTGRRPWRRWWTSRIALAGATLLLGLALAFFLTSQGWSEPGPEPRTSETIVADPHTPLVNAGVEKPYLLTAPPEVASVPSEYSSSRVPAVAPAATSPPETSPVPTTTQAPSALLVKEEFTLRTAFRDGRFLYVGVGGAIDGVVNPDLVVAPGTVVEVTLVNGDSMVHDLFFPDFNTRSELIGHREQTSVITFIVANGQAGTYAYYCTVSGHRESGQEGRMVVTEQG